MLEERGVFLDHTTIFRWVIRFTPFLLSAFQKKKRSVGGRWRMDETYVKVNGKDRYLYRAVDKEGQTVEFLLTSRRDRNASRRFLEKAMKNTEDPSLINIDQSGANTAGIKDYNKKHETEIEIRQCKYLNNIVEQDWSAGGGLESNSLKKLQWSADLTALIVGDLGAERNGKAKTKIH